ncbi:MAG TPA: hypothetical protein VGX92_17320 [Pyrinomonadaceae bacterium]|nr:hypothetical protein [Pyrinomonadaceae bacterium]
MQEKHKESTLTQHGFAERNNFYFGKFMTARDFTDEQSYMNEKRWMVNRFGLGWGVLCGLKVRPHARDKRRVIVEPGFAIDPYGHEILVCREETVDLLSHHEGSPPEEPAHREAAQIESAQREAAHRRGSYLYYISIMYEECGVNPSPILIDSCDGYKEECVYNRTRESYRFIVSREKPDSTTILQSASSHGLKCEAQCQRFLQDPSPVISGCCPERPQCEAVPLAAVCYNPATETTAVDIDLSMAYRKVAFSNEMLYELLSCLRQAGQGWASQLNRRQHVPLLASTIKGLKYQNGKTAILNQSNGYTGKQPFRMTSDGDYIWVTDREDRQIWRIDRATNKPIKDSRLYLDNPAWGIAYDGRYMWISHHEAFPDRQEQYFVSPGHYEQNYGSSPPNEESALVYQRPSHGRLTRIDVCTLERRTIDGLPQCNTLPACYRFPEVGGAPYSVRLNPYAGEVVLHDGDIYVAHDVPKRFRYEERRQENDESRAQLTRTVGGYHLYLTRIDPVKGCIVEVINVPESDEREPLSRIEAMASDGDALWITYRASSRDRKGERAVVRKITKQNGTSMVGEPHRLKGEAPDHMVFDGTRLWVSHNDGLSVLDIETGEEETVNTDTAHTALAYSGGSLLWSAVPGKNEAFITRVDIFSEEEVQRIEFLEVAPQTTFEISDMQFDGTYIYVAYHLTEGQTNRGVIHRLLP